MTQPGPPIKLVRSLRNGQITIPAEFRRRLGIEGDSLLQVTLVQGELRISPVRVTDRRAGAAWLEALYDRFASVREEAEQYSEEEINSAIEAAVSAVRKPNA